MVHALPLTPPSQACLVFMAEDIFVKTGVNSGEGLAPPLDVCAGDIYALDAQARATALWVSGEQDVQTVAVGSGIGQAGQRVQTVARYTLMETQGARLDLLLIRVGGADGTLVALPLSPMAADVDYTLVDVDDAPGTVRLADVRALSFARGMRVTLSDGSLRAIETLAPGDRVLTRDHGAQPLRWVGRATLRAVGAFAPVVISAGHLGNLGDLVVSQQHRMFLYQRHATARGPSEIMLQARHLVNGDTVYLRQGGFVDYLALVFDSHEIVYVEGIPVESLLVTDATVSTLPPDLSAEMRDRFPNLSQTQHFGTEAGRQVLDDLSRKG